MPKKDTRVHIAKKQQSPMSREELEDSLILKVYEKVSDRIDKNEATAMELVHFLKLGSSQARLDKERQQLDMRLTKAKTDSIAREKNIEQLYDKAIKAYKNCEYSKDNGSDEGVDDV